MAKKKKRRRPAAKRQWLDPGRIRGDLNVLTIRQPTRMDLVRTLNTQGAYVAAKLVASGQDDRAFQYLDTLQLRLEGQRARSLKRAQRTLRALATAEPKDAAAMASHSG